MTIIVSEVLRVRNNATTREYDVLLSYNETLSDSSSRLEIEIIPLAAYVTVGKELFTQACAPLTSPLSFDLAILHSTQEAKFATRRDVLLPEYLHSCGLGSYIFNRLISWGQKIAPTFVFRPLSLAWVDAQTEQAKARRNGFYRAHNFKLNFDQDPAEENGRCDPAPLASLVTRPINSAKILSVSSVDQVLHSVLVEKSSLVRQLAVETRKTQNFQTSLQISIARNRKLASHRLTLILLLTVLILAFGRYMSFWG